MRGRPYVKVSPRLHTGSFGRSIRGEDPDMLRAQSLAAYLVTCPHGNAIGVFFLPVGYITADRGWTPDGAYHGASMLEERGLIRYDRETEWVWVVDQFRHEFGPDPKRQHDDGKKPDSRLQLVESLVSEAEQSGHHGGFLQHYKPLYPYLLGRINAPSDVPSTPRGTPPSRVRVRLQEQEQEQEQDTPPLPPAEISEPETVETGPDEALDPPLRPISPECRAWIEESGHGPIFDPALGEGSRESVTGTAAAAARDATVEAFGQGGMAAAGGVAGLALGGCVGEATGTVLGAAVEEVGAETSSERDPAEPSQYRQLFDALTEPPEMGEDLTTTDPEQLYRCPEPGCGHVGPGRDPGGGQEWRWPERHNRPDLGTDDEHPNGFPCEGNSERGEPVEPAAAAPTKKAKPRRKGRKIPPVAIPLILEDAGLTPDLFRERVETVTRQKQARTWQGELDNLARLAAELGTEPVMQVYRDSLGNGWAGLEAPIRRLGNGNGAPRPKPPAHLNPGGWEPPPDPDSEWAARARAETCAACDCWIDPEVYPGDPDMACPFCGKVGRLGEAVEIAQETEGAPC